MSTAEHLALVRRCAAACDALGFREGTGAAGVISYQLAAAVLAEVPGALAVLEAIERGEAHP